MGTRHLIAVILDGKHRIAQYGQWDGYPDGQGAAVLDFCHRIADRVLRAEFESNLRQRVRFMTDADMKDAEKNHGGQIPKTAAWRLFSRDHGAKVLDGVLEARDAEPLILRDQMNFAADSLFCEWAYVLDLDANRLECFKGFNHSPVPDGERFAGPEWEAKRDTGGTGEYYPVRHVRTWALDSLPDAAAFVEALDGSDEEAA